MLQCGRDKEAVDALSTATQLNQWDASAFYWLGVSQGALQADDLVSFIGLPPTCLIHVQAEEALRKAIQLDSRHQAAHSFLGTVLQLQHRSAEAKPLFERAVELDNSNAAARYGLALSLRDTGNEEGFAEQLRESVCVCLHEP